MSYFKISKAVKVVSGTTSTVIADTPDVPRAWGFLVPTGSAVGTASFADGGEIYFDEVVVGQTYPARLSWVKVDAEHVYILT